MPDVDEQQDIDVVVMDFAMQDFRKLRTIRESDLAVTAANFLAPERGVAVEDFEPYAEGTLINEVFGRYARIAW
jgi:hypothetical protein